MGKLEKAQIFSMKVGSDKVKLDVDTDYAPIDVCFNPKEYSVEKGTDWEQSKAFDEAPMPEFKAPKPMTMSVTLQFDTYEDRVSVRGKYVSVFQSQTSQANLHVCLPVSKRVMVPAPETPRRRLLQFVARSRPSEDTAPRPVTTTRRFAMVMSGWFRCYWQCGHAEARRQRRARAPPASMRLPTTNTGRGQGRQPALSPACRRCTSRRRRRS